MKNFFTAGLFVLLVGCTSPHGFDRGAMTSQLALPQVINDNDIRQALDRQPQLKLPFRVAVYFVPPLAGSAMGAGYRNGAWRWTNEDKDQLLGLQDTLKASGIVSEVFLLNDGIVSGRDRKAVRLAAAQAGADAVMIVSGTGDFDRYNNNWGISYFLLLPALFVPGTHIDGVFESSAALWDVRNDFLYAAAEAEGTASQTSSAYGADPARVVALAKTDATVRLGQDMERHLLALGGKH